MSNNGRPLSLISLLSQIESQGKYKTGMRVHQGRGFSGGERTK